MPFGFLIVDVGDGILFWFSLDLVDWDRISLCSLEWTESSDGKSVSFSNEQSSSLSPLSARIWQAGTTIPTEFLCKLLQPGSCLKINEHRQWDRLIAIPLSLGCGLLHAKRLESRFSSMTSPGWVLVFFSYCLVWVVYDQGSRMRLDFLGAELRDF